ncbi:asparaginase [Synechococcus sp. CS-602]|uniref:asparaginase n=1 Tax=Synechococcaceae TaxID=1890426 RepID=UPI0008FF3F20|nr:MULTISPECIES: asparaginase [Synechococcaceae]MCT4365653.1 asparaginase [Candidatus Regnicoccus frigidus MAG-AL1]APD47363.1 asparaginase [Synechococcus sp. SynAce01]MCT0202722.1 asparaginase [Synechococcus sp. CS-603]MCT0203638.1 asparaginase [Synechococcus sp. CS-602]MCT0246078.1 asparaginase [Synechococcus sp. CS-601]
MTLPSSFSSPQRPGVPPLEVLLLRNGIAESVHRVHAVVCDQRGRVLMRAGDPQQLSFVRSALKPFQAQMFVSSGAADQTGSGDRGLAIACSSHTGTPAQAREAFKILWSADLEAERLQCPQPRPGASPLEHNCSGKHAAFLATCRRMNWALESYLQTDHPLQQQLLKQVGELLGLPGAELVAARDDCGAPTLQMQLAQMALLFAHLGASEQPELERLSRAMLAHPELVAGEGRFDTELMRRSHGLVVSKGGAEGIQCLARMGEGLGLAIKVEDGASRAKQAVALHLLKQLDWLTPLALEELGQQFLSPGLGLELAVQGELRFD